MDQFNNKVGMDFLSEQSKPVSFDRIEKEGLKLLRNKKLKVLKPKLDKIPDGYYSE
jgi:hypothetical protein